MNSTVPKEVADEGADVILTWVGIFAAGVVVGGITFGVGGTAGTATGLVASGAVLMLVTIALLSRFM